MRFQLVSTRARIELHEGRGATRIALGLAVLLASAYWPALPVMTGMALIALGATFAVVSRFRCSPVRRHLFAAHLFVYSTLYLLFVGAVLHAVMARPGNGLSLSQGLDLVLSIVLIVAATRIVLMAIAGDGDVPAR